MAVSEKLKKLIITTAVKDAEYDPETGRLIPLAKELNSEESAMLQAAIMEEGYSLNDCGTIINDVLNSAGTTPRIQTKYQIQPDELPLGQHIVLVGNSDEYGIARLEMMCIAPNRFIVLNSERRILQKQDILESAASPWNVRYKVNFKVFRNGSPFPAENYLYQTYRLDRIELHNPPVIYDYLDNKNKEEQQPVEKEEEINTPDVSQPEYIKVYCADQLTSNNPRGFYYAQLTRQENYKGGIFEICLISATEARLRINERQMVQDKVLGSLNILEKACEPCQSIAEPRRIVMLKEGILTLSENKEIWLLKEKMQIELRRW